jgi:Na+-transporting NADH:ubiquinone oxidoreductase subunit NqrB
MRNIIDAFLDRFAMYRFVLYVLIALAVIAIAFGFLQVISFRGIMMLFTLIALILACYVSNYVFSTMLRIPANLESSLITALILFFVLSPITGITGLPVIILTGIIAIASKYLLAIKKRHIFNPAAVALVIIGILGSGEAIWWVATPSLMPFVFILGFAVVWKIRRFPMVFTVSG